MNDYQTRGLLLEVNVEIYDWKIVRDFFLHRMGMIRVIGFKVGELKTGKCLIYPSIAQACESLNMERLKIKVRGIGPRERKMGPAAWKEMVDNISVKVREYAGLSVSDPQGELICLYNGGEGTLMLKLAERDRKILEERAVKNRPFFMPTSIHPKIAKALMNCVLLRKGQRLLDPFCGTGGILIEGALLGAEVFGCDIDPKMVRGTEENLEHYVPSYRGEVREMSFDLVRDYFPEKFNAVVTDPPYGHSTRLSEGDRGELYRRFLDLLPDLLVNGGRAACVLPVELSDDTKYAFNRISHVGLRVHGSLTRHIYVLERE